MDTNGLSTKELLQKGKLLIESGQVREAMEFLDKAYVQNPNDDNTLNVIGLAYFKLGKLENAYTIYRKLIHRNPSSAILRLNLGVLLYKKKDYKQALAELKTAEKLEPDNRKIYLYKGMCLEQLDEWVEAMDAYEKAGSIKNAKRLKDKMRNKNYKFKVVEPAKQAKPRTTKEIIEKHFGDKALPELDDDENIDKLFIEKEQPQDAREEADDELFDASQLADEFSEEDEERIETMLDDEDVKDEDTAADMLESPEQAPLFDDEDEELNAAMDKDILEDMNDIERKLHNLREGVNAADDTVNKVDVFLTEQVEKEKAEYKEELQDNEQEETPETETPDAGAIGEDLEDLPDEPATIPLLPEESDEEEADMRMDTAATLRALADQEEAPEPPAAEQQPVIMESVTLEAMTRKWMLRDADDEPIKALEGGTLSYRFHGDFTLIQEAILAVSGACGRQDLPKPLDAIPAAYSNNYTRLSGEGLVFIKQAGAYLLPIKLFGDVFSVRLDHVLGVDTTLVKDVVSPDEDHCFLKLEGKGNLVLALPCEPVSLSVEEDHAFQGPYSAFLGFMGINPPTFLTDIDTFLVTRFGETTQVDVKGPGIVFLFKDLLYR